MVKHSLLFMDGAVHAALWTTGPLLLPSLLSHDDHHDAKGFGRPPLSAEEATSTATTTTTGTLIPTTTKDTNSTYDATSGSVPASPRRWRQRPRAEDASSFASSTSCGAFATALLLFAIGRAAGRRFVASGSDKKLFAATARFPRCIRGNRRRRRRRRRDDDDDRAAAASPPSSPPWRVACGLAASLTSLLSLNWGWGAIVGDDAMKGWMAIRFATAFVSGGVAAWGERESILTGRNVAADVHPTSADDCDDCGERGVDFGDERTSIMEEGRRAADDNDGSDASSPPPSPRRLEREWTDAHWLAGAAACAFLGGWSFRPLDRLVLAFRPRERPYVFLMAVGLGALADWCLVRYHSKREHSIRAPLSSAGRSPPSKASNRRDDDDHLEQSAATVRSSSLLRRKQVRSHSQIQVTFEEEQQPALFEDRGIQRSDSFGSEQFFDCLDDIELDGDRPRHEVDAESGTTTQKITMSTDDRRRDDQIAVYSKRRVTYPDGAPAHVPAGESRSRAPPGYLALLGDLPGAREAYLKTQEWRRRDRIDSVHDRPHPWFPRIKDAYPHVVHGHTSDGMLVVYESPGRMDLKSLFRNGCKVDDMVFHYCYLMEYLSNLEGILTELHSDRDDDEDGDGWWQEELASYAHAKQERLRDDPVAYGFCVVMDVRGAGPGALSGDVLAYLKRSGDVNAAHYPGSMRRAVVVNAPYLIGMAWRTIRGLVPKSVTVDLLSESQTREEGGGLGRYIDEDQIPVEYGGRSKYKLGEHPFEVGLKKLVERQGENIDSNVAAAAASFVDSPPLNDSATPFHFPPDPPPPLEMDTKSKRDSSTPSVANSTPSHEWDGLGSQAVLTVAAILHFFIFVVIGSLEVALPYWMISPPIYGGLGCEARRNGTALLVSCVVITWAKRRPRFSRSARSVVERTPLRGFRIGTGATCFVLICLGLLPLALDPNRSTLGLLCFSTLLSLLFFGCALGILSLEHLRSVVVANLKGGSDSSFPVVTAGRIVGYIFIAPVFRWSIRKDLFFPFNASFSLCLLAGICWLLYIVSFSLHAAAPPSLFTDQTKPKESQFMSAMVSWFSFIKEVMLVAHADVNFLANELRGKGSSRSAR